jgi:hypothetical protein
MAIFVSAGFISFFKKSKFIISPSFIKATHCLYVSQILMPAEIAEAKLALHRSY